MDKPKRRISNKSKPLPPQQPYRSGQAHPPSLTRGCLRSRLFPRPGRAPRSVPRPQLGHGQREDVVLEPRGGDDGPGVHAQAAGGAAAVVQVAAQDPQRPHQPGPVVEGGGAAVRAVLVPGGALGVGGLRVLGGVAHRHLRVRRRHLPRGVLRLRRAVYRARVHLALRRRRARHRRRRARQRRHRAGHGAAQWRALRARVPARHGHPHRHHYGGGADRLRVVRGYQRCLDRADGVLRRRVVWVLARVHDGHHVLRRQLPPVRRRGARDAQLQQEHPARPRLQLLRHRLAQGRRLAHRLHLDRRHPAHRPALHHPHVHLWQACAHVDREDELHGEVVTINVFCTRRQKKSGGSGRFC